MIVGEGGPNKAHALSEIFADETTSRTAAQAELARLNRSEVRLSLTLPGDARALAEAPLQLQGFNPPLDGR